MATKKTYKIGDTLVDCEAVYRVVEIKDGLIKYRPLNKEKHESLIFSIPEDNLYKAGIRRPLSKEEVDNFFKDCKKIKKAEELMDYKTIKETLWLNDPVKSFKVLKTMWIGQKNGIFSTNSDLDQIGRIIGHLAEEFALSTKVSKEKMIKQLEKLK